MTYNKYNGQLYIGTTLYIILLFVLTNKPYFTATFDNWY